MPVSPTYPGVYIQEIPSGVRTITGVATAITAFIGRAARGPINEPVTINNFGDYQRVFGGLDIDSTMSYAVRDFFLNGGGQAIIVRLFKGTEVAKVNVNGLKLEASSPGTWGNNLAASVDTASINDEVAERYGLSLDQLFNLTVVEKAPDGSPVKTERHHNLTIVEGERRIDRVLEQESQLVRVQRKSDGGPDLPEKRPTETPKTPKSKDKGKEDSESGKSDEDSNTNQNTFKFTGGVDGDPLTTANDYKGDQSKKEGLYALEKVDLFNLLCIPPDSRDGTLPNEVYSEALNYCLARRAMLIVDPPSAWGKTVDEAKSKLTSLGLSGTMARNAALYFPRVRQADPLRNGQIDTFVPCGIIAGIMARTDAQRGVWKAPAGLDAALSGVQGLEVNLSDAENGMLNPLGINCLRSFPVAGTVVWGARTLRGADQLADEYKYVPVRRLALYIEESLYRGTQWVVFEPNDEPLWAQIRLNIGAFMHNLFRQGAFQGQTPRDAYFVKCDKETTTQNDINLGIVNIVVGFAPLKPAEFVIISIQQIAGAVEA